MPSPSIPSAAIAFLDTLMLSYSTPITAVYFDIVPLRNASNAVIDPPYIVVEDQGGNISFTFEYIPSEFPVLKITVWAYTLDDCGLIVNYMRFGGQNPDQHAGFDFAQLSVTGFVEAIPHLQGTPQFRQESDRSDNSKLLFACEMRYEVYGTRSSS